MTATTEKYALQQAPLRQADLELKDIIKTLPKECFEKDRRKAWFALFLSVGAAAIGYLGIALLPWYFLPFTWFFTGTALTGWFVVAHDCGHRSFAKRRWVNDWVGHLMMMPLLYPFHSWRIMHDHHHLHTNKMEVDNAWHPWTPEFYWGESPVMQTLYRAFRGRLWWLASVAHWGALHFAPSNFAPRDRQKVRTSITVVLIFAACFFPALIATTGLWGVVKFWLMPWLGYHFWMSTFTLVHHTAPDIQFHPVETWNAVEAQLAGTVHCRYPRWVELLCHNINVHVPHHLSVAIPSYRLRLAHQSLRENWGDRLQECTFSWSLMKDIVDHCHIYHPEKAYQSFKALHNQKA
jgi:omega-6 fatty acid desaturase (delta-12 desaturase)